jgi:hypothetical protein
MIYFFETMVPFYESLWYFTEIRKCPFTLEMYGWEGGLSFGFRNS